MTAPEPEPSPVDMGRLNEVAGGDPQEMRELSHMYLEQTTELLEKLSAALTVADAPAVKRIAHNCAGTSAACGMTAIVPAMRELERLSAEGRLDGAATLRAEAEEQFQRIRAVLEVIGGPTSD